MKIAIRQKLSLALGSGLPRAAQHLLVTPQSGTTQSVLEWSLELPGIEEAARFVDAYGNVAHLVTQSKPDEEVIISLNGIVETVDRNGVVGRPAGEPPVALFKRPSPIAKPIGAITSRFRAAAKDGPDRIPLLHALMERVDEVLGDVSPSQEQSQSQGGQSQSQSQSQAQQAEPEEKPGAEAYAHAFIGAARSLGIPARFVSGYLLGDESEAAFHYWAEAWDDGLGWIGFDALLQYCPTDSHVRVAIGLDAVSTMPIRSSPTIGAPTILSMQVEAV